MYACGAREPLRSPRTHAASPLCTHLPGQNARSVDVQSIEHLLSYEQQHKPVRAAAW